MRPAICSCVLERKYSVEDAMRVAADLGYEGYEIDIGPFPHYSVFGGATDLAQMRNRSRWQTLARAAEAAGIEICSLCLGALHGFGLADPDESIRLQGISLLREACRAAADIGVRVILVPIPQPPGTPVEFAQELIVASLRACVNVAETSGVVLGVENMPNGMFGPASQVKKVIDRVASLACRVYYDLANPEVKGIHAASEIPLLAGLIEQVHIKDLDMPNPDRVGVVSIGDGQVDLIAGLRALEQAGYDGFVTVEVPSDASEADCAAEVNLVRLRGFLASLRLK